MSPNSHQLHRSHASTTLEDLAHSLIWCSCHQHGQPSQAFRKLFLRETIRHAILMRSLVLSCSRTDQGIHLTAAATEGTLGA